MATDVLTRHIAVALDRLLGIDAVGEAGGTSRPVAFGGPKSGENESDEDDSHDDDVAEDSATPEDEAA